LGESVVLYDAAPFAGGRCRSFLDKELGTRIDNGSHLILSGNEATQNFLRLTNSTDQLYNSGKAVFPFVDVYNDAKWKIEVGDGKIPWWLFDKNKRIPGTKLLDYWSVIDLCLAGKDSTLGFLEDPRSSLYNKFWKPLIIGALNTEPEEASAKLLKKVFTQTFLKGGKECVPLFPKIGLTETFIDPCLSVLESNNADIRFYHRLKSLMWEGDTVRELLFNNDTIVEIDPEDWVVLALPAWVMRDVLPEVPVPTEFRSILSSHFRLDKEVELEHSFTGIVNGHAEWLFARNDVVSVTVSCAERYRHIPPREVAYLIWKDVAKILGLNETKIPTHRIFLEKCATIAATPKEEHKRPSSFTGWKNIALAGEWTATELPSTIEGAIRSGIKAAQIVRRWKS